MKCGKNGADTSNKTELKLYFSYVFRGAVIVKTFWGASTFVLAAFAIGGPALSADHTWPRSAAGIP